MLLQIHTHTVSICTKKLSGKKKKKINKDESHAQQQPFPVWPGEFSASNWSDQVLSSSVTWGSVTHTSNSFPLASSHTEHDARCRNITVFLPGVLRVRGWGESVRYSGGRRGETRNASESVSLCSQNTCITKYHVVFQRPNFSSAIRLARKSFWDHQRWFR